MPVPKCAVLLPHGSRLYGMPLLVRLSLLLSLMVIAYRASAVAQPLPCNGDTRLCALRYDQVTYPMTHNAFSRFSQFLFPNQLRTIPKQLEFGIRGMMLDIYYAYDEMRLCHIQCDTPHGYITFSDTLGDIKAFLAAHPQEVLTLVFETYVAPQQLGQAFVDAGLLPYLYAYNGHAWPTLQDMITTNHRLVVFSSDPMTGQLGANQGHKDYPWLHSEFALTFETPYSYDIKHNMGRGNVGYCAPDRGNPQGIFILNHFISPASYITADEVNGFDFALDSALYCQEQRGRLPNFIAVDYENCDSQYTCNIAKGHNQVPDIVHVANHLNTLRLSQDSDGDGLPDWYEEQRGTNPVDADTDHDGLSDKLELQGLTKTDPLRADTDADGLPDGMEDRNHNGVVDVGETSPVKADSDADGLSDGEEVQVYGTNPLLADSDGDYLSDSDEVHLYGTNPLLSDSDADGFTDSDELQIYGTNPLRSDSDGDGVQDGQDVDVLRAIVSSYSPHEWKPRTRDKLLNALQAVEQHIALDHMPEAVQMLEDLLPHFDGCARSANPDRSDWLMECGSQLSFQVHLRRFLHNVGPDDDQDMLWDYLEDRNGNGQVDRGETDPANRDSDGDGLLDGLDVEWLQNLIMRLPATAFLDHTVKTTMIAALNTVETRLLTPSIPVARTMSRLGQLRRHVDGCGTTADSNDWIVDCARQRLIHRALDRLITNWQIDRDGDGLWDWEEDVNRNGQVDPGETDPDNADSDGDVIPDGVEVLGSNHSDPLDADSDDDGLKDGDEDWSHNGARDPGESDPRDADSDDDGATDGYEFSNRATDLLDPDSDDDELRDGLELFNPVTCAVCVDSDLDGIRDGEDVEYIVYALEQLPANAFLDASKRQAMLGQVSTIEMEIALGQISQAMGLLQALRQRVDGCGAAPNATDWIVTCSAQQSVRTYVDLLLTNLSH